ncbi:ATP-binding protein (plasmid) [Microbacterium hominis]|nr:ATP-binding protein [Microbacterium hominis]
MSQRRGWSPPRSRGPRGFFGAGGGKWNRVPQPAMWGATSIQACGIYPFVVGTARPTSGAPLGRDLISGTAVCMDHASLFDAGVISSPSAFLLGLNGVGKSSTAQTMMLGMMGRGMVPAVFNPLKKGEHTGLVSAAGGDVFEFGPTATHRLNLLSPGPMGRAAARIGGAVGAELAQQAEWRVVQQTQLALRVSRGARLEDFEDAMLEALVHSILTREKAPVTGDLLRAFESPSPDVLALAQAADAAQLEHTYGRLGQSIRAMLSGDLGRLLGGTESVEIDPGNRGGFCFDTSQIDQNATKLLSTAMLMSWSLGMDSIDAHWQLYQADQREAAAAAEAGERYTPQVAWNGYTTLMDEFWYPMRSTPGIADRVDALARSNRSAGVAEMKITHSPKDMLALPDPKDREVARGLIEKTGLWGLMALTAEDLRDLAQIKPLTEPEISMVAGFNGAQSWGASVSAQTATTPPPGAGKVLFKVDGRPGIPVQMVRTQTQQQLHVTDERFRAKRREEAERALTV